LNAVGVGLAFASFAKNGVPAFDERGRAGGTRKTKVLEAVSNCSEGVSCDGVPRVVNGRNGRRRAPNKSLGIASYAAPRPLVSIAVGARC
jgi:hypothetical protein